MADDADANRFEAALDGVLKAFPGPGLVDRLETFWLHAGDVIDICQQEFRNLQAGVELPEEAVEELTEAIPCLQEFTQSTELTHFYVSARGLTSEWLHFPGDKKLLVHSVALHVAEILLQFPDLPPAADVDWSIVELTDPGWLIKELKCEYGAARDSLKNRRPSKYPPRMAGDRNLWRFRGHSDATDDPWSKGRMKRRWLHENPDLLDKQFEAIRKKHPERVRDAGGAGRGPWQLKKSLCHEYGLNCPEFSEVSP
jgi:hypothetical protein